METSLRDWNKNRIKSLGIDMGKLNTPSSAPYFPLAGSIPLGDNWL